MVDLRDRGGTMVDLRDYGGTTVDQQDIGGPASSQGSGEIWIGNEAPPSSQAYKEKHVFSSYQIGLIPFPPYTTAQEANIGCVGWKEKQSLCLAV